MINTFNITTAMGKYFGKLPFLSETELEEFNSIGYCGKTTKGEKINRESYLNSLNKGEFHVSQTKFDDGGFEEQFIIVWVHGTQDNFKNSPIHNKRAILELLDDLKPEQMIKVVEFIQSIKKTN